MDKLKQWMVLTIVGSVVIMAAGWFLAIAPKRAEAADLRAQAADQESTNSTLTTQLQVLMAQAKELPKEQAKLAAVAAKIPADPALPGLVRVLLEAAERTGVELVSVSPSAPELVAPAVPAAPAPAPAPQAQTTPEAAAGAAPVAPAGGGPAGQLAKIPVAINVVGDFFEVQQFMDALETLPRSMRVDNLSIVPGKSPTDKSKTPVEDGKSLSTQISGLVFMAANRPPATAATVPGVAAPADATADAAAVPAAPAS